MKKGFLIAGLILLAGVLFLAGAVFGQSRGVGGSFQPGAMMGSGRYQQPAGGMMGYGQGMMNSGMMNGGMMNGGMMGSGMMGSGMMNGAMMGGSGLLAAEPLSIQEAETAVLDYLATLDDEDLSLGEIMIFDNHAYAQIVEEESGRGAFEVLVDPVTRQVYPEPGPNMMWNTEYGHMSGFGGYGMMAGMMGSFSPAPEVEINVTAAEAVAIAQRYLDTTLPGTTAGAKADPFPGYYTLHVEREGRVIGMLSVNAYSGQVFAHHWHGDFVEMAGEDHD